MLCDICKKNPATIHIQEISNGEKKTLHLCQECAEKKASSDSSFNAFNLAEVLYNISNTLQGGEKSSQNGDQQEISRFSGISCPSCGWDFDHLRKTGRLGCPECYKTFEEYLKSIIPAMHRGTVHRGKVPPSVMKNPETGRIVRTTHLSAELEKLRTLQKEAIRTENYERAAVLRDQIADLEKQLDDLSGGKA